MNKPVRKLSFDQTELWFEIEAIDLG